MSSEISSEMKMSTDLPHVVPKCVSGEVVKIPVTVGNPVESYGIQSHTDEGYIGMPSIENDNSEMSMPLSRLGIRLAERMTDTTKYEMIQYICTDLPTYNEFVAHNHALGEDNGENIAVITDESLYEGLKSEKGFKEPNAILGNGSFGSITERTYMKKGNVRVDTIVKEIRRKDLNRLEYIFPILHPHPGITKVQGFMEFPKDKICRLFMENGGVTLKEFRTNAMYHQIYENNIMRQILETMEHIHRFEHLYFDLKPANILVEVRAGREIHIHLCDFGAIQDLHNLSDHIVTSPKYQAPECHYRGRNVFSDRTDMFSVGGVLYFLITGKDPWESVKKKAVLKEHHINMYKGKDVDGVFRILCPNATSDDSPLYDLMVAMLDGNPKKRPSAKQALDYMNELEINMPVANSTTTSIVSIPLGQASKGAALDGNVVSAVVPDFGSISDASVVQCL